MKYFIITLSEVSKLKNSMFADDISITPVYISFNDYNDALVDKIYLDGMMQINHHNARNYHILAIPDSIAAMFILANTCYILPMSSQEYSNKRLCEITMKTLRSL